MAVERRMGEREKSKDRDSTSTQTEADSVLYRANWRKVLHGECLRHSLRQSSMIRTCSRNARDLMEGRTDEHLSYYDVQDNM